MDEHHLEVRRQGRDRSLPVLPAGEGLGEDPLEGHALWHGGSGGGPIGASLEGSAQLLEIRILLGGGMADVRPDGALYVAADEPLADQMRHGPDGPEPLHAEVVGEALGPPDDVDVRVDGLLDLGHGHGAVPDCDLERVADQVAELYGAASGVDPGDLHILQADLGQVLGRASEGHELRRDGALVLGPREPDPGAGHPDGAGQHAHEAVGLPVAAGDGGDGELAALLLARGIGDLPDDEVLWKRLEVSAGPVGVAQVSVHADAGLCGEALAVQGDHSLIPEKYSDMALEALAMASSGSPLLTLT